jgi:hypothetical protein
VARELVELSDGLERQIRGQVAKESDLKDARSADKWVLRGTPLRFYRTAWLVYLERLDHSGAARPDRIYFVAQQRQPSNHLRLVPMANETGSVDRANRECSLSLPTDEEELRGIVLDYLNFYYAFTPQYDPILTNLNEGPAHFGVPQTADDLRFSQLGALSGGPDGQPPPGCTDVCLAQGAVWHYLEERDLRCFAVTKLKMRQVPYLRVTGRIVVQYRRGLFAADFRLPTSTYLPSLTNPELLYESEALREPPVFPGSTLRISGILGLRELWRALKATVGQAFAVLASASIAVVVWAITILVGLIWLLTAIFPLAEMTGWQGLRVVLHHMGQAFGLPVWPQTLFAISLMALITFLGGIVYTTHMDRIFNWLFWLCPREQRAWLAEGLARRVNERDREFIAQDTFRNCIWWAFRRLIYWTGCIVLAFASMQIALNVIYGLQNASAARIVITLLSQAAVNVPLILYVLVRVPGLLENLDPIADGILSGQLLFWFHAAMVLVVIKGIYRMWIFTVEASPFAFYRRLPVTSRRREAYVDT